LLAEARPAVPEVLADCSSVVLSRMGKADRSLQRFYGRTGKRLSTVQAPDSTLPIGSSFHSRRRRPSSNPSKKVCEQIYYSTETFSAVLPRVADLRTRRRCRARKRGGRYLPFTSTNAKSRLARQQTGSQAGCSSRPESKGKLSPSPMLVQPRSRC
jgi:hypothetical protein